jgi:hypothetical protein
MKRLTWWLWWIGLSLFVVFTSSCSVLLIRSFWFEQELSIGYTRDIGAPSMLNNVEQSTPIKRWRLEVLMRYGAARLHWTPYQKLTDIHDLRGGNPKTGRRGDLHWRSDELLPPNLEIFLGDYPFYFYAPSVKTSPHYRLTVNQYAPLGLEYTHLLRQEINGPWKIFFRTCTFPAIVFVVLFAWPITIWWSQRGWKKIRTHLRRIRGQCLECGYNLHRLPVHTSCPECGVPKVSSA